MQPTDTVYDRGYAAIVALSGWWEHQPVNREAWPVWRNGTEIAGPLTEWTTRWLNGTEGLQFLHANGLNLVPREQMPTLLHAVLADQDAISYPRVDTHSTSAPRRSVKFTMKGHLIVFETCSTETAAQTRANLTRAVTELAHRADYIALFATGFGTPTDLDNTMHNNRGLKLPRYYNNARYLDRQNLPDAFEWQIVTDQHLARAHLIRDWTVTDLGGGMHELIAPDPDAWHDPDITPAGVSPEVLERARRQFGYLILHDQPF